MNKLLIIITILSISITGFAINNQQEITKSKISNDISSYLNLQINDQKLAEKLTKKIIKDTLYWTPPTISIEKGDYIVAFSFGNRLDKNGNSIPGPMNEQIADLVVKIYNKIKKPVYAQWEVAQSVGKRVPLKMITALYPKITKDGKIIYLSTSGVAKEFIKIVKKEAISNKTIIALGFREHEPRIYMTCKSLEINAYAPKGYSLPDQYDKESGQPWTRSKYNFMIYDMAVRLNENFL